MMNKTVQVIRHLAFEDLGNLASVLSAQGFTYEYIDAGKQQLEDCIEKDCDLLIVLGGPIGVYDRADYPFLSFEIETLKYRLQKDLPTLGICLGAQLMAEALGGRVYGSGKKEIGWGRLYPVGDVSGHPVHSLLDEDAQVLHWHGDTFALPDGAVHLLRSDLFEQQAFQWGRNGLALQFHPEVTEAGMEQWYIGHACEISAAPGVFVQQLRNDTATYCAGLQARAGEFWRQWLSHLEWK